MPDALHHWEQIRGQSDIQFGQIELLKEPPPPDWLARFFKWLVETLKPVADLLGVSWPILQWILLGIAILLIAWLLWRLLEPIARIRL